MKTTAAKKWAPRSASEKPPLQSRRRAAKLSDADVEFIADALEQLGNALRDIGHQLRTWGPLPAKRPRAPTSQALHVVSDDEKGLDDAAKRDQGE